MLAIYDTKHMKKRRKKIRIFRWLILAFILYILYSAYSVYAYSKVDETRQADAAIILGAGAGARKPSPVFEERIRHGIWLYENGYVEKLIFTGGQAEGNDYSDASVARDYAIEHGVAPENILIEEKSRITWENLIYASKIVQEQGMQEVLIVSDPLHMRRAMLMAENCQLQAYSSPTQTTRYITRQTKVPFWIRESFFYMGFRFYNMIPEWRGENTVVFSP
jgi:Uncharacterized conserved protein